MKNLASIVLLVLPFSMAWSFGLQAADHADKDGIPSWAADHRGTSWSGPVELWIDPTGNDAKISEAAMQIESDGISYSWSFEGEAQSGELRWAENGLRWKDTWHQPDVVQLDSAPRHGSIVAATYAYPAGQGPDWHWRIKLSERPDSALVLQMTNIASWGEEARAVRMVLREAP